MPDETDDRMGLLSASFTPIAANCAGSLNLVRELRSRRLIIEDNSKVSSEGIEIHEAMETGDLEQLDLSPREVAVRLKFLEEKILADWMQLAFLPDSPVQCIRETRLWIRGPALERIISARVDVSWYNRLFGLVVDYKSGYLDPTPAEVNWQMKTQAVTLWRTHGPENVRAAIAASRCRSKITSADFGPGELRSSEWELQQVVKKAETPDAPRHAGYWCRYCPAKAWCREYTAWSTLEVVPFNNTGEIALIAAIGQLSPVSLKRIWEKKKFLELLLESVTARLKAMPSEELEALGLKLSPGQKRRNVVDINAVVSTLTDGAGAVMSKDELIKSMGLNVGTLDEIVATKFSLSLEKAKEKVETLFGEAIEKKQNSPSIKPL